MVSAASEALAVAVLQVSFWGLQRKPKSNESKLWGLSVAQKSGRSKKASLKNLLSS